MEWLTFMSKQLSCRMLYDAAKSAILETDEAFPITLVPLTPLVSAQDRNVTRRAK
jgi:hypothetical protein